MTAVFLIGVLLELLSGTVSTLGKQLVGLAARSRSVIVGRTCYFLGLFMAIFLGSVLDASAYGFAPQSILAPISGLEISLNIALAPCILKEALKLSHIVGTLFVGVGAGLAAAFGCHESTPLTLEELESRLYRWPVACYLVMLVSTLVLCAFTLRRHRKGSGTKARALALGVAAGALQGNMFCTKCTAGLIRRGVEGDWSPWHTLLPYILACGALLSACASVPLMARGLTEFEAVLMVTLVEGCSVAVACVSGDIVLGEMDNEPSSRRIAYWACILLVFVGLWVIQTSTVQAIVRASSEILTFDSVLQNLDLNTPVSQQSRIRAQTDPLQLPSRMAVLWMSPTLSSVVRLEGVGSRTASDVDPACRRTPRMIALSA